MHRDYGLARMALVCVLSWLFVISLTIDASSAPRTAGDIATIHAIVRSVRMSGSGDCLIDAQEVVDGYHIVLTVAPGLPHPSEGRSYFISFTYGPSGAPLAIAFESS